MYRIVAVRDPLVPHQAASRDLRHQPERCCVARPDDTEMRPVQSRDGGGPQPLGHRDDSSVDKAKR